MPHGKGKNANTVTFRCVRIIKVAKQGLNMKGTWMLLEVHPGLASSHKSWCARKEVLSEQFGAFFSIFNSLGQDLANIGYFIQVCEHIRKRKKHSEVYKKIQFNDGLNNKI